MLAAAYAVKTFIREPVEKRYLLAFEVHEIRLKEY